MLSSILAAALGSAAAGFVFSTLTTMPARKPGGARSSTVGRSRRILVLSSGTVVLYALTRIVTGDPHTALAALSILLFPTLERVFHAGRINRRRASVSRELPLFLDHLALQVGSGHAVQQAVLNARRLFTQDSPLGQGLLDLERSVKSGHSLEQALDNLNRSLDSPEAEGILFAVSQAVRHGTPLGKVLRDQSRRMREHLILEGERFANTLSVKILLPLLFFIFPASFLVIFSPVIVSLAGRLP